MATSANTHLWAIAWDRSAKKVLDDLPSDVRMAVFDSLCPLLRASNPLAVDGVCKVQSGTNAGIWRVQARAKSFDARVFFELRQGKLVINKFEYQGALIVRALRKRDGSTYD